MCIFSVISLMNDYDSTRVAKMSGGRKEVLLSLSKAQLTNTSLTISSMLPSTHKCSPPSVACLRNEVSWQTNQFCSEQSLSSHVHLVYHWKSANCAGSPIDCSNWVQLQLYSFHFLYSVRCQLNCRNFGTNDEF